MEQLYSLLGERKRLPEAQFVELMGGPVLVFKPGESESAQNITTGNVMRVKNMSWTEIRNMIKDDANRYRAVRLRPEENERIITIGRTSDNEIPLNYLAISKHHARMYVRGTKLFIADLDSRNGTTVNDKAVGREPFAFNPPATIALGHIDLRCLDPKSFYAFLGELLR